MTELKDVIETLDNAADSFESIADKEQKKIYGEVITLAKDLDLDASGKVKQSIANLKRLTQIKAKLAALSKDKEWVAGISGFAAYFGILQKQQNEYFSAHFPEHTLSEKAKEKNNLMRQMAVQNTMEALMGDGLKANVTDKLNDILLRAVTTGAKFGDLQEELRAHLLGKEGGQGAFARYATTYATTALSQYTGQTNKLLTEGLDTDWFMYTGSNKETTREFCEQLTKKKYIHRSEIATILTGRIDDYQCAIYPKTGLPYGMIEGTTVENFQCNCGGWNCRHQLVPVAEAVVPASLRAKFGKKEEPVVEPAKKEPIDLAPYRDSLVSIEEYLAGHPRSEKLRGYYDAVHKLALDGDEAGLKETLLSAKKDMTKFLAAERAVAKRKERDKNAELREQKTTEAREWLARVGLYKGYNPAQLKMATEEGDIKKMTTLIEEAKTFYDKFDKLTAIDSPRQYAQDFTFDELKAAEDGIKRTLSGMPSDLYARKNKLEYEIKWVEEHKKYPTWKVAQEAYEKELKRVNKELLTRELRELSTDAMAYAATSTDTAVKKYAAEFGALLSAEPIDEKATRKKLDQLNKRVEELKTKDMKPAIADREQKVTPKTIDEIKTELGKKCPKTLEHLDESIEKYEASSKYGAQTKKYKKQIEATMQEVFDKHDFGMNVDDRSLDLILNSWFKNLHEVHRGGGSPNETLRRNAADVMFSLGGKRLKAQEYEKYGNLLDHDILASLKNNPAIQYGNVHVRFKKDKVLATWTPADSLGLRCLPTLCSDPKASSYDDMTSYLPNDKDSTDSFVKWRRDHIRNYLELQYHGDLTIDCVESIAFPYDINTSQYYSVALKWKAKGVKIYYVKGNKLYEL